MTAGGDGAIVLWPWNQIACGPEPNGELIASLPEPVFCICEDGGTVWAGTQKGNLYRLKKGEQANVFKLDLQSIYFIQQWDSKIWVGTGSGKLVVLNENGDVWKEMQVAAASLRCIHIGEDSAWIGASDAHTYRIDLKKAEVTQSWRANEPSVFGVVQIHENILISVGRDAQIRCYFKGNAQFAIPAHLGTIHGLSINAQRTYLATGSMDKSIKIWSIQHVDQEELDSVPTIELKKVIHRDKFQGLLGHTHSVNAVRWLSPAATSKLNALMDGFLAAGNNLQHDEKSLLIEATDPTNSLDIGFLGNSTQSLSQYLFSVGDDRQALLWKITEFCEP